MLPPYTLQWRFRPGPSRTPSESSRYWTHAVATRSGTGGRPAWPWERARPPEPSPCSSPPPSSPGAPARPTTHRSTRHPTTTSRGCRPSRTCPTDADLGARRRDDPRRVVARRRPDRPRSRWRRRSPTGVSSRCRCASARPATRWSTRCPSRTCSARSPTAWPRPARRASSRPGWCCSGTPPVPTSPPWPRSTPSASRRPARTRSSRPTRSSGWPVRTTSATFADAGVGPVPAGCRRRRAGTPRTLCCSAAQRPDVPVLLLHGDADEVVPMSYSSDFADGPERRGAPHHPDRPARRGPRRDLRRGGRGRARSPSG